ncbi:MAG: tetratricopeptide repeat protein [Deltaproteobacteria bacterium]|nr:tetratricopeptide repeat protein [Deltaproteobacteria bacterium]
MTIVGNPGLGKTRLINEFLGRIREREPAVRAYRGVCRERGAPFALFGRMLRARFGLVEGADTAATSEKFRDQVSELLGDKRVTEFLHFLGHFLDLKFPASPFIKAIEEEPAQFQQISRTILRRFFEADAARSPLVLTFEDLHLAQNESLDLIHYLIDELEGAPVLIICTCRPEILSRYGDWWAGTSTSDHVRMELAALGRDDSEQLFESLLQKCPEIPDELVEAACDMAGGSPFFLEQMVRIFLENGTLLARRDGTWAVDLEQLDSAQLPLTVDDAIQARIGALSAPERELLERATTMGSVFWLGALVALGREGRDPPELWGGGEDLAPQYRDTLAGLMDRDYILKLPDSSIAGDEEYAFKHNLERDMLHRLASPGTLKRNHLLLAQWLEHRVGEKAEEQYELLAQHYELGGARFQAAHNYIAAGDLARRRYANAKAADYYGRGLEMLGEDDAVKRIDTLHNLGDVCQIAGRNEEALQAFNRMLVLAWRLDLRSKGGAAHNRIGRAYRDTGRLEDAMRHLGAGLALFDGIDDERGKASSLDDIGKVHWLRGNYELSLKFLEQALDARRRLGDKRSIALSLNNLGLVHMDSAHYRDAREAFEQSLALRREIGDMPGVVASLNNLGTVFQDQGDHRRSLDLWAEALEGAREVGDRLRQAYLLTNIGEAHYRMKQFDESIRILRQAEEIADQLGDRLLGGECARGLGKAHMLAGDLPKARELLRKAIDLFEQLKSKVHIGVALRTLGEVTAEGAWGGEEAVKARECFDRSLSIFEELGNEIELGKTCRAYAAFLTRAGLPDEGAIYRDRDEAIMRKLGAAGSPTDLNTLPDIEVELVE